MIQGKYVIVHNGAILFPESIAHSDFKYLNPLSAGFFIIDNNNNTVVYGDSHSLNLKSKKEDSILIEISFREK